MVSKSIKSPTPRLYRAFWDADLGADVWGIVGVAQLGSHVEAELFAVLHSSITKPDADCAPLQTEPLVFVY